jgi:hypothetical protein
MPAAHAKFFFLLLVFFLCVYLFFFLFFVFLWQSAGPRLHFSSPTVAQANRTTRSATLNLFQGLEKMIAWTV